MPISPDKVRELTARPEGTALDFKAADYDWSKGKPINNELAKDLMALANGLRPNSEPAYVLIGVRDDGTIVGVDPLHHLDDAKLHQKVQGILNRTPTFSYAAVEVDGRSVGVHEIRGGGRPFFPLRDAPPLHRHVALYRNGSATDVASPTMILEWAREDDPDAHRLRSLELRKLEAEARIYGRLASTMQGLTNKGAQFGLRIENHGRSGFLIETLEWELEWNDQFREDLAKAGVALPEAYNPPRGEDRVEARMVPSGGKVEFTFSWKREQALAHFADAKIEIPGFKPEWADYHFAVPCRGELGGEETLRWTFRPPRYIDVDAILARRDGGSAS